MSNDSAIAAVTATLQQLIETAIKDDISNLPSAILPEREIRCTTLPPDKANEDNDGRNRINLFLFHTAVNAALRNMDIPRLNEQGQPPLALNLYYLITAYGEDRSKLVDHLLLGRAMRALHDQPLLTREILERTLPQSGLHQQVERVRITPEPMSVDEISKLWTTFQTQYRISAAYQASVVLIESQRGRPAPLPVLRRGRHLPPLPQRQHDYGAYVLGSPASSLHKLELPHDKPSAELGDTLVVHGSHLDPTHTLLRFRHLGSSEMIDEIKPLPRGTEMEVQVKLPAEGDDPSVLGQWPIGMYTMLGIVQQPERPEWRTNEIPFALAPRMEIQQPADRQAPRGTVDLTLICKPQIQAGQRVVLLFGNRQVEPTRIPPPSDPTPPPPPDPTEPTTLEFNVKNVEPGDYVLRLRVDGVDSLPIKFQENQVLEFDKAQKVTVT